jgi:hypothetical protein
MGAWGSGNFENDAVSDWLAELADWSSVQSALDSVLDPAPDAYVGADACCIALGAAEIVAACLGKPGRVPEKVVQWASANREHCDERIRALANACVCRIDVESELQELFDEGGRNEEWHGHMQDLLRRLSS